MSLKAKLEAVIYAAEEPVTLAQLAVLFADEAFIWKAEQEAASAERAEQTLPLEETEFGGPERIAELLAEPRAQPAVESFAEAAVGDSISTEAVGVAVEAAEEAADASEEAAAARAEAEERRAARLRDREVRAILRQLLDELITACALDGRGVEIREIAGGYRMATKPECHDAVRQFVRSLKPALKLSLPALETLAVIAYKQPVTAPEVNEIRGVDASGVFGSLLARKLIATAGRKQVIGRPILYKTTREFLLRFGLKDVSELPSMEEFEKMAASELDEPEMDAGEEAEERRDPALGPEFEENASEELEEAPSEQVETQTETTATDSTAAMAVRNEPPPSAEAELAAPPAEEE